MTEIKTICTTINIQKRKNLEFVVKQYLNYEVSLKQSLVFADIVIWLPFDTNEEETYATLVSASNFADRKPAW